MLTTPPHQPPQGPLRTAWQQTRSGQPDQLVAAERQLAALAALPDADMDLVYERAFNLVKQGRSRRPDALRLLAGDLATRVVDALSLWGRCFKDEGDEFAAAEQLAEAEAAYARAEERYELAYAVTRDRFPGINAATMRLLRAALLRRIAANDPRVAALRAGSAGRAAEVLAGRADWVPKLPDDHIWMPATEAEAHALQANWSVAVQLYGFALRQPGTTPMHKGAIARQLKRLCDAFRDLGIQPPEPFDLPDQFILTL